MNPVEDCKVLLVDDEVEFLETLVKRMKKRDLDVEGFGSSREALDRMDRESCDVLVLDVRMPGMDGMETLREIKKRHPLVEVIMLTGHADVEVAIQGMELGAFDYLMKPMDIDDLLYKIQDAFKKKSIQEARIRSREKEIEPGE